MAQAEHKRAGTHWFVSDGYLWDEQTRSYAREDGGPRECALRLFVYNPQSVPAMVVARFYHTDREPTRIPFAVAPETIETLNLSNRPEIPHRQAFWIEIESDVPTLPQSRHADYTGWEQVPDALTCVAPYPGPLVDETEWVFPDCYQSDTRPWYERELLTILNPGAEPVSVQIRYLLRYYAEGGEEIIEIPAGRVAEIDSWNRLPRLIGMENGPPIRVQGDFAVRLKATGPIIAQTTRRAYWAGRPDVIGSRSTMGAPLRERENPEWIYPGGLVLDRGVLPRRRDVFPLSQCDNDWNLLFIHNLSEAQSIAANVTFYRQDGRRSVREKILIPPRKSSLEWMHGDPYLGNHVPIDEPYALIVTADAPVVPGVCGAEFEMWSQVMPGAMTAVNLYPGPLTTEKTWWLGIGHSGGDDSHPTEWRQWYHLFNPGDAAVQITLTFLGIADPAPSHSVTLEPGGVERIAAAGITGLPPDRPFAVRADGDAPFCAQVFGRTVARKVPDVRAAYSFLGVPMELTHPVTATTKIPFLDNHKRL